MTPTLLLQFVDAGPLCIAKLIKEEHQALHDHIFKVAKPKSGIDDSVPVIDIARANSRAVIVELLTR